MAKASHKGKRKGFSLDAKTFKGKSGDAYLVFRKRKGNFHGFVETEPKRAAKDVGAKTKGRATNQIWESLWRQ